MKSLYNFVISPLGERYNNIKKVGNKELILNTEIYNHEYINREAIVISCPLLIETDVKPGDKIIVHHNVFRRWHDVRGVEKNSKAWFSEDKYIVSKDQIYLYNQNNNWKPLKGFSFVQPLKNLDTWNKESEHKTKGIIKYTNSDFNVGDIVGFTPFSKYEFVIDGVRLYRVYDKFITIKYEYQGDEETYNPSWAQSS
tara:strand:+ start:288 stop:878 length:591 start_codon:yes stop_codon:yes gene_type:complete